MSDKRKLLLLVDDSEIDLEILRTIVEQEFNTLEATSAAEAMDFMQDPYTKVDAMLLDISMPKMDGFSMLDFMKKENLPIPPVLMISSEATQNNVTKALLHHAVGFIRKPFQKEDVFRQIHKVLPPSEADHPAPQAAESPRRKTTEVTEPWIPTSASSSLAFKDSMKHVIKLRDLYVQFLNHTNQDIDHYTRMISLMSILLEEYQRELPMEWEKIELLSYAAFFVDIGRMVYPFGESLEVIQLRTQAASDLFNLNPVKNCHFFIEAASALCKGFYHKDDPKPDLPDSYYTPFVQMCILADRFDSIHFGYPQYTSDEFSHTVKTLKKEETGIFPAIFRFLVSAEPAINRFYRQQQQAKPHKKRK